MGAVGQHHFQQFGRRFGRVDRPPETGVHEFGQQAAVVDMGMGEQDEVEGGGFEPEGFAVPGLGLAAALDHAAIHEKTHVRGFHQKA